MLPAPGKLTRVLSQRQEKTTFFPLLMHILEQGLTVGNKKGACDAAHLFQRVYDRNRPKPRGCYFRQLHDRHYLYESENLLQRLLIDWKAIPKDLKARIIPEQWKYLDASPHASQAETAALAQSLLYDLPNKIKAIVQPDHPAGTKLRYALRACLANPHVRYAMLHNERIRSRFRRAVTILSNDANGSLRRSISNNLEILQQQVRSGDWREDSESLLEDIGRGLTVAREQVAIRKDLLAWLDVSLQSPLIDHIEPEAAKGYYPGDKITIIGERFSRVKDDNTIQLLQEMPGEDMGVVKEFTPSVASNKGMALTAIVPDAPAGQYYLQVTVKKGDQEFISLNGAYISIRVPSPPIPPRPIINSIGPREGQYPGRSIIINGANFQKHRTLVAFGPLDGQQFVEGEMGKDNAGQDVVFMEAKFLNENQLEIELWAGLLPGQYRVAVLCYVPARWKYEELWSKWFAEYRVRSYRFTVKFPQCEAVRSWAGYDMFFSRDNLLTTWAVVHDNEAYGKCSNVHTISSYGSAAQIFGSSIRYGGEGYVVSPGGEPIEVRHGLVIDTELYSLPPTLDVSSQTEAISVMVDLSAALGPYIGAPELAIIAPIMGEVISLVLSWLNDDDRCPVRLGAWQDEWSLSTLQSLTHPGDSHLDTGMIGGGPVSPNCAAMWGDGTVAYRMSRLIAREP